MCARWDAIRFKSVLFKVSALFWAPGRFGWCSFCGELSGLVCWGFGSMLSFGDDFGGLLMKVRREVYGFFLMLGVEMSFSAVRVAMVEMLCTRGNF